MTSVMTHRWQPRPAATAGSIATLATVLALACMVSGTARAAGTAAGTVINNRSTVSYSVGGIAQTPIESSPTGNANPGVGNGTDTTFLVDRKVNFTVAASPAAYVTTTPGAAAQVTRYIITNTSNAAEGFQLSAANLTGGTVFGNTDTIDLTGLSVFVDGNADGIYEVGTDTATNVNTIAADTSIFVFLVGNVPNTAKNGDAANVQLTAKAAVSGTNGATLEVNTAGPDNPNAVDVVLADGVAHTGVEQASGSYLVQSAALTITKQSLTISDPFNGTTNPKAIPGATVEYTVTMTNNGTVAASPVTLADPLNANLTLAQGVYNAGASNVTITVGAGAPTYCTAEAGGTDTNGDGCVFAGGALKVAPTAAITLSNVAPNNIATIKFRATIN
jgi:uncharacterized repeat protein (TIGR01451 family)